MPDDGVKQLMDNFQCVPDRLYAVSQRRVHSTADMCMNHALFDKSMKLGTDLVHGMYIEFKLGTHRYRHGNRPPS